MAIPKSTLERIMRKVRLKKPFKSKTPDFTGRIVPKKTGNNDPTRNHCDLSENVYKLYNGDEVECDINEMLQITNKLISQCSDVDQFPMSLERLVEMREELESNLTKPVITALPVKCVYAPRTIHMCPHCNSEIHEKGTYYENEIMHHSVCKGPIVFIDEIIPDSNGSVGGIVKGNIDPAYLKDQIELLSDFYVGKNGVHSVMETEVNGVPAILFITDNGELPLGCPQYNYIKVLSEKGNEFNIE
jgi:hypothetical protein